LIIFSNSEEYDSLQIDDLSEFLLSIWFGNSYESKNTQLALQCLNNAKEKGNENALFEFATHCSGMDNWIQTLQTKILASETLHDVSQSILYFERFLRAYPSHYVANYRIGYLYKNETKDLAKAKQHLFRSYESGMNYNQKLINASFREAAFELGQIYEDEDDIAQALRFYKVGAETSAASKNKYYELQKKLLKIKRTKN